MNRKTGHRGSLHVFVALYPTPALLCLPPLLPALLFNIPPSSLFICEAFEQKDFVFDHEESSISFSFCFSSPPPTFSLKPLEKLRHVEGLCLSSLCCRAQGRLCWPALSKSFPPTAPKPSLIPTCTCCGGGLSWSADGCSCWAILRRKKPVGKEHGLGKGNDLRMSGCQGVSDSGFPSAAPS